MSKSEVRLQKQVTDYLKENNIYYLNIHGGGYTAKGAPDLLICIDGQFVAFELKVGNNKMQPDQIIHKRRIERSSGQHFTPRTLDEAKEIIKKIREEESKNGVYYFK